MYGARAIHIGVLPDYTLTWQDTQGTFTTVAHLEYLSNRAAEVAGLDATQTNIMILFADPLEGNPRIRDGMAATFTPSFDGLTGKLTVKGRPRSQLIAQVEAEGLEMFSEFSEDPGSVDEGAGWEVWQRLRRVRVGLEPDTKAPRYEATTENVRLKLTKPPTGDETTDFDTLTAQVLALTGTLKQGDVVTQAEGESYVVIASPYPEGDYERAELRLREY